MFIFLLILAIIISMIIIAMVAYGIYFIIAAFQLAHIRFEIQDIWEFCTYAYCFMDEENKKVFSERLEREVNKKIDEVEEYQNKVEVFRIQRLKQVKSDVLELYSELNNKILKCVPLARRAADEETSEIKSVVNILIDVLQGI